MKLNKYKTAYHVRRARYRFATSVLPQRFRPPMVPSVEMLERCARSCGDHTFVYRFHEYYVDPIDNEVVQVKYR